MLVSKSFCAAPWRVCYGLLCFHLLSLLTHLTPQDNLIRLSLEQRFSIPVLAPPPPPPLCIFCISLFVNTPDSDNQLVRSVLRAWTVFRLTCSLHRVHWSLLPEQGNPLKFTSFRNSHSWICAAQRLHARTSVASYTSVNIYNFNSRLAHFEWNIYVRFELESWRNILWCPLRRALTIE